MSCTFRALRQEAHDPARLAAFWAGLLHREPHRGGDTLLLPGTTTQLGLRFVAGRSATSGPSTMHLHLTSTTTTEQRNTVDAALALGASHLDVGQRPEEPHVVLADPEGNEFCVLGAGNSFLAGCGFLGELTCNGGPEVGHFWSRALGRPLVWERDQQTAVQSPHGGTKISWDTWPGPTGKGGGGRRFELAVTAASIQEEVDRLIELGAGLVADQGDEVELDDPGGVVFVLSRA